VELPIHVHGLTRASCVDVVSSTLLRKIDLMMTVQDLSTVVIEKLKTIPSEHDKHCQETDYKSFWDEYKEQLQFQMYLNYDIFEENVKDLAYNLVNELSTEDLESIFNTIKSSFNSLRFVPVWEINRDTYYPPASCIDKKNHIICTVLSSIQTQAKSEEVEYKKPHVRFVKYIEEDNTIVAELIQRLNPWEYKLHSYSRKAGSNGNEEIINLLDLKRYNRLREITEGEFISLKDAIISSHTEVEKVRITKAVSELIKILTKADEKRPLEVIREMKYELEQRKLKSNLRK
jgi:hypothetical protein